MKRATISAALLIAAFVVGPTARAVRVEPEVERSAKSVAARPALPSTVAFDDAPVIGRLGAAIRERRDDLAEIAAWNDARRIPRRIGFFRALWPAVDVNVSRFTTASVSGGSTGLVETRADGTTLWHGRVTIQRAKGLRVHLNGVDFSAGTHLWLRGASETIGPIDPATMLWNGEIWCPLVRGSTAEVIVEIPPAASVTRFTIDGVMEAVETDGAPSLDSYTTCQINAECTTTGDFDAIDLARGAIAEINFVEGRYIYQCTGGLVADTDPSTTIPYFITANHCVSTQSAASSVVARFDYRWTDCSKTSTDAGSVSHGATLLATSAYDDTSGPRSDFTLLRLNGAIPSGRSYLGWDSSPGAVTTGTTLYRVSHPAGDPQSFTSYSVLNPADFCTELPKSRFIYEENLSGSTTGGSSGSPVMIAGGYVVGQLFGSCGVNGADPCTYSDFYEVDGKFSESFAIAEGYLDCQDVTITADPADTSIEYGKTATLSVTATGSDPISYQWYRGASGDTSTRVGTDSSTYTTPALAASTQYWVRVSNACSSADSATATVTVGPCSGVRITSEPSSVSVSYGSATTLQVSTTGTDPRTYQWYRGASGDRSSPITGETSNRYRTPPVTGTASYWMRATNACGTDDSATATVTPRCADPKITSQSAMTTIFTGTSTTLEIAVSGTTPLAIQWYANGNAIAGAHDTSYTTPSLEATTVYTVVVTGPCGTTATTEITVNVHPKRRHAVRRP